MSREVAGVNKLLGFLCVFLNLIKNIFVFFISDTGVMILEGKMVPCSGTLGVSLGFPVTSESVVQTGLGKDGRTDSFTT